MKASRTLGLCVIPCSISVVWLTVALGAVVVGWGIFAAAAVYSVRHHAPMVGYEWIWGFLVMPLSWLGVAGIRRGVGYGEAERTASENERFVRMFFVTVLIGGACVGALISVPVAWFDTGHSHSHSSSLPPSPSLLPMLLHMPSASAVPDPAPHKTHHHASPGEYYAVGILLLVHFGLLCLSTFAFWQYGENWRIEQQRIDEDPGVELTLN